MLQKLRLKPGRAGRGWDAWAAGLSLLCLVHCLALPLFVASLPVLSVLSDAHWVHVAMVMLALPITGWVMFAALSHRESLWFVVCAVVGLGMMVSAVTLVPHELEAPLTVAGGTLLAVAHLWRWRRHHLLLADETVNDGNV